MKFATGTVVGTATSAVQIYNLNNEIKKEKRRRKGITGFNNIAAIQNAQSATVAQDLEIRQSIGDESEDMTGIVRMLRFIPTYEIVVHTKSMAIALGEMSLLGPLVVTCDSTGQQLTNKDCEELDDTQQHLKLCVQPTEVFLSKSDALMTKFYDMHVIVASERVSPSNTDKDVAHWLKGLSDDVKAATRTAWNLKEGGADLDVGIMKCDNAGQIITGTLIGLGKEGMVDHQKSYSVLALATLLRLDGLLEEHGSFEYTTSNSGRQQSLDKEVSSTAKECAVSTYNTIKKHAPCLIKVCNTHTLLAQARGVKKMKNKPREIVLFKTQYENIFGGFAKRARHVAHVSTLIVEVCILLKIFGDETIELDNPSPLTVESPIQKKSSKPLCVEIATAMDKMVKEVASEISFKSDSEMEEMIQTALAMVGKKGDKQSFKGMEVAKKALALMTSMKFTHTYLCKVDKEKEKGTIRVAYVYSPYKEVTLDKRWQVSPSMTGGIEVIVNLPFHGTTIPNKLYSVKGFGYWKKWVDKVALWGAPITSVAEKALDSRIFSTSMSCEGQINGEKTFTSHFNETFACVESFVDRRWKDSIERERMLVKQLKELNPVLDQRKKKNDNKKKRKGKETSKEVSQSRKKKEKSSTLNEKEACTGSTDNDSGNMVWKRTSTSVVGKLRELEIKMKEGLAYMKANNPDIKEYKKFDKSNSSSMWLAMKRYESELKKECEDNGTVYEYQNFMSRTTFLDWMGGRRDSAMKKKDTNLILKLHKLSLAGDE